MKNVFRTVLCIGLATNASAQSLSNSDAEYCEENCEKDVALWISNTLEEFKDPFTAHIRNLRVVEYTRPEMTPYICAEINAKNSYGAYIGWKLFSGVGKGGDLSSPKMIRALGNDLRKRATERQLEKCSLEPLFFVENADALNPHSQE